MTLFYVRSAAAGTGTGLSWANAKTSLAGLTNGLTTAGDTVYVAADHAESTTPGAQVNFYLNGANMICVDHTASGTPYVEADLRTTAVVTYNGNNADIVARSGSSGYIYGINFVIGVGATTSTGSYQTTGSALYEKCTWTWPVAVTSSSGFWFSSADVTRYNTFVNCTWSFPNANTSPFNQCGNVTFRGCYWSWAYTSGVFFSSGKFSFEDCDLTGFPNLTSGGSRMFNQDSNAGPSMIRNCRLSPTVKYTASGAIVNAGQLCTWIDVINSSVDGGLLVNERWGSFGVHTASYSVARTGGASDGITPVSWKLVTASAASTINYFEVMPLTTYNIEITTSMVTVAVEGIADPNSFSALPKTTEVWLEAEYFGNAARAQGSLQSGGGANIFSTGIAHAASTQAWDSKAPARANSTGYVVGDVLKVASNAGRLFFCTSPGTSASSEPGGYASATDGSAAFSDGTAQFRAGWRFKMTVQLGSPSPKRVGPITVFPKMAKASASLYLDPLITLS